VKYDNKTTVLCGWLTSGRNVTIKLVDTKKDELLEATTYECVESTVSPGLYMWDTENLVEDTIAVEVAYIMTADDGDVYGGKIVIDKNLTNTDVGNWEMKDNQMIMYNLQGEEIARYDLFNAIGKPSMVAVTKREKVE
jgi:hypothetical protein